MIAGTAGEMDNSNFNEMWQARWDTFQLTPEQRQYYMGTDPIV